MSTYVLESNALANAMHMNVNNGHMATLATGSIVPGEDILVTYGPSFDTFTISDMASYLRMRMMMPEGRSIMCPVKELVEGVAVFTPAKSSPFGSKYSSHALLLPIYCVNFFDKTNFLLCQQLPVYPQVPLSKIAL
jgi:hypothetical protein